MVLWLGSVVMQNTKHAKYTRLERIFIQKYKHVHMRQDLSLVTVSPAVENTLSAVVDVAGTHRYLLAISAT